MHTAVAPKQLHEVSKDRQNGIVPNSHGEVATDRGRGSLMARLDDKGAKEVTLKQSTIWFVATVLILAGVLFSYATSAIGWIREDEAGRVERGVMKKDIEETRQDMKDLNDKFDTLQKSLNDRAVAEAELKGKGYGYSMGQLDAHGKEEKK